MAKPKQGETYRLVRPTGIGAGTGAMYAGQEVRVREIVPADEVGAHDDTEESVVVEWEEQGPTVPDDAWDVVPDPDDETRETIVPNRVVPGQITRSWSCGVDDFSASFEKVS